jgi:hypothetical protein
LYQSRFSSLENAGKPAQPAGIEPVPGDPIMESPPGRNERAPNKKVGKNPERESHPENQA